MSIVLKNKDLMPSLATDFFETGKLFPSLFDFNGDLLDFSKKVTMPDANIIENEKDFKIEVAVPGMEKKDFKIEVQNDILTISAEKEKEKKEEKKNYKKIEFSYSAFSRSFTLPVNSLPDKIDAKYENGILLLTIPKKEVTVSKPKKEIKVS